MALDKATDQGVRYLLGLIDEPDARTVCARLGTEWDGPVGPSAADLRSWGHHETRGRIRGSLALWMAEQGALSRSVTSQGFSGTQSLPLGLGYDLAGSVMPVEDPSGAELLTVLYSAVGQGTLGRAREAADQIRGVHWAAVMKAHAERPLPGFARWALIERVDCPPLLREAFGTHAKFRHRMRQAGIYESPSHFVLNAPYRAADLLPLLGIGRWGFPEKLAEAEQEVLAPLVRANLGAEPDAWAVLAQLLPGFTGSLSELLTTAGAVAGPVLAA